MVYILQTDSWQLGGGVLSDCWRAEERGRAISIYSLAPLLGPAVGPIAGAFITENTSWRWAFWATSIADAIIQVSGLFFLKETYPPKLLHEKAEKLRKETGNPALHTEFEHPERSLGNTMKRSLVRPFILLGTQPIVQVLAIYMAYLYGLMYLVLSTFPGKKDPCSHSIKGKLLTFLRSLDGCISSIYWHRGPKLHLPRCRLFSRHANLRSHKRPYLPSLEEVTQQHGPT